jgi:phosphatidylserine/phosphatidylglycerophosphate/cardiolipin synthase-like enzyme
MRNAVAFANNDVVTIAWSYGERPDGCMGFEISRIDADGREDVLPSHAVFPGGTIKPGQTTSSYPIQKFYWKDVYARIAGEKTKSFVFRYKIVPLEGAPGKLTPMPSLPILTTNAVEVTGVCSPSLSATFNRGLISTQHVSHALDDRASKDALIAKITTPNDILDALTGFLARTSKGGAIYAALYELTDTELIAALVKQGSKLHLVVADIAAQKAKAKNTSALAEPVERPSDAEPAGPENDPAHDALSRTAGELFYRKPPSSHIVHNKFLIYADARGKPKAVLTGSTNWTATGLCAQTNNALVIDDDAVAARYMSYWKTLKADEQAHEADPKAFQAAPMRAFDGNAVPAFALDAKSPDPSELTSYFSPNTPKARGKNRSKEAEPIDLEDLEARVLAAKHAVLFLAFIPGTPSITNFAAAAQRANKDLFVRGCVTAPAAAGTFYYALRGTSPPKAVRAPKGQKKTPKPPVKQDPRVIAADALTKSDAPKGWSAELLNAGFAITHDKIVVLDPFSDDCTVVTGSHNLGYQASYNNDENMVIIQGNKKLAMAYATHVLDVYDHFSWRWATRRETPDAYLKVKPDEWLSRYFNEDGEVTNAQLKFWMQATVD